MTAEERRLLRLAVDRAIRARLPSPPAPRLLGLCGGCGRPWSERTPGCLTCFRRWDARERMQRDPAFAARVAARKREARQNASPERLEALRAYERARYYRKHPPREATA